MRRVEGRTIGGIAQRPGHGQDGSRDLLKLDEVDAVDLVGWPVVVLVQAAEEERHGDALLRVLVVVAPLVNAFRVGRVVVFRVQREIQESAVHAGHRVGQRTAQPTGAHQVHLVGSGQRVVARRLVAGSTRSTDHVEVQLRDDVVDWHRWERGDVLRAPAAAFLAGVPHEQQRPLRSRTADRRRGHLHQRHHPRPVVVCAVVDEVLGRRLVGRRTAWSRPGGRCRLVGRSAARSRPRSAKADVIEVRTKCDELRPEHRVGALDTGDDVEGVLAGHSGADLQRDALGLGEGKRRARILGHRPFVQARAVLAFAAQQRRQQARARGHDRHRRLRGCQAIDDHAAARHLPFARALPVREVVESGHANHALGAQRARVVFRTPPVRALLQGPQIAEGHTLWRARQHEQQRVLDVDADKRVDVLRRDAVSVADVDDTTRGRPAAAGEQVVAKREGLPRDLDRGPCRID